MSMEDYRLNIRKKIKELLDGAKVEEQKVEGLGTYHKRKYLVEIYEENTEFLACMQMLAEISRWFHVKPLADKE